MKSLNLNAIDPAELMPTPEIPETYGPRNEEERRVHELVKEALDADNGVDYDSVEDLVEALRKEIPNKAS